MGKKFGFSFSWKRASGLSAAKGRISRAIGIPLTRSGRERKLGRLLGGFPFFGGRGGGRGGNGGGGDDGGGGCCGCLVLLIVGAILWAIVAPVFTDSRTASKPESAPTPPESRAPQPQPPVEAATEQQPLPLSTTGEKIVSPMAEQSASKATADAKLLAVKYHPDLGVGGSPLNKEFVARYKRYQAVESAFFDNPSWPLTLAEECAQALRAKQKP